MKKVILTILLFIMLLPFIVKADSCDVESITIESITMENSNGIIFEKSNAIIENNTINLDIKMSDVGDNVQYKIDIRNDSDEDVEVGDVNIENDYIDYTLTTDDNSNIIERRTTKPFYLNIEYKNEIPVSSMNNGTYNNNDNITVNMSTKEEFINPKTGVMNITLIILSVLVISAIAYRVFKKNAYVSTLILLIGIIIPLLTFAACKYDFVISSNIEISNFAEFDTGSVLNNKMINLATSANNIKSFKRSNTLPDNIKTLVDNQISTSNNLTVTEEELNEELENMYTNSISSYIVKEENGFNYYCYNGDDNYCDEENYLIVDMERLGYVIVIDNEKYLVALKDKNKIAELTKDEFKNYIKEEILYRKKNEVLSNVFSSRNSEYLIYGWYDSNNIYYYCENEEIFLNRSSSSMFSDFKYLENISGIERVNSTNVFNISEMFRDVGHNANNFEINLSSWNTSNVIYGSNAFSQVGYEASSVNINLSNWDLSKARTISGITNDIGYNSTSYNVNLSNWKLPDLNGNAQLFYNNGYNATIFKLNLSNWDLSNNTNLRSMFHWVGYNATTFELNLSNWKTNGVTNMSRMFDSTGYSAETFRLDLSSFDTSNVTDMSYMFVAAGYSATTFELNISGFDTSKVTDMHNMFDRTGYSATTFELDLSSWDTKSVTNMESMFSDVGHTATTWSLGDISHWNTSNVTNMSIMFGSVGYNATTFNLNLSSWDVSNVTNMNSMFSSAGFNSTTWSIGDLSSWNTSNVTNMSSMFMNAGKNSTTWQSIGTLKVYATNTSSMFNECRNAKAVLNIYSNPTNIDRMFSYAAIMNDASIVVNYASAVTNIDNIINTKSSNSNVVKGELLD